MAMFSHQVNTLLSFKFKHIHLYLQNIHVEMRMGKGKLALLRSILMDSRPANIKTLP